MEVGTLVPRLIVQIGYLVTRSYSPADSPFVSRSEAIFYPEYALPIPHKRPITKPSESVVSVEFSAPVTLLQSGIRVEFGGTITL